MVYIENVSHHGSKYPTQQDLQAFQENNVSYLGLEKGNMLKADFNPTGKIQTQATNEPNMRDYAIELKRLGYKDHLDAFYRKAKLSQIDKLVQASFCDDLMKDAITKLIKKRYRELENELNN